MIYYVFLPNLSSKECSCRTSSIVYTIDLMLCTIDIRLPPLYSVFAHLLQHHCAIIDFFHVHFEPRALDFVPLVLAKNTVWKSISEMIIFCVN